MIILIAAALSGIVGAMLIPPDRRFGYAVASAIVALSLGTAVAQATIVDAMIAAAITAVLPSISAARPIRAHGAMWNYLLVVLIGSLAALAAGGLNPFSSFAMLLGVGIGLIASSMNARERGLVWTVVILVAVGIAGVLVTEVFVLGRVLFAAEAYGKNPFISGMIRGQATVEHPLVAGFVCVVGLFAVLRSRAKAPLKIVVVLLMLAGVLATGSSTTVVVAAAGILGWLLVVRGRISFLRVGFMILVGAGVVVLSIAPTALLDDVFGSQSAHRLNSLRAVPRLLFERSLLESLFGSGFGSARNLYGRGIIDDDGFFAIDNQFVTILASAGVIGFVLFTIFVVRVFLSARTQDRVYFVFLLAVFFGFDVLPSPAAGALFVVFVAGCIAESRQMASSSPPVPALTGGDRL